MRPRRPVAPKQRAHARQQLSERKRLDQVIVGSEIETADRVLFGVTLRQDQNRRPIARRAEPAADLETIERRYQHVEDDRFELGLAEPLERVETITRALDTGEARGASHIPVTSMGVDWAFGDALWQLAARNT